MLSVKTDNGYLPIVDKHNFSIIYDYEGGQTLSFDISPRSEIYKHVKEKTKLKYGDNIYNIRKINKRKKISTVTAEIDLNDWKQECHLNYHTAYKLFSEILPGITPHGWVIEGQGNAKGRRAISLEGATNYDVLMACKKTYGIVYEYRTAEKKIKVIDPSTVQQRGLYLTEELNLDSVEYKGDFTAQANRLYAYGKKTETQKEDGTTEVSYVTFADINGGKPYVDCMDYVSDEIVCAFWQDDRYENPEELIVDAREKVKTLAYPVQSWGCNIYDLSRTDAKYRLLDFKLYDKPVLITDGQRIVHQIVQYNEYPDEPNRNRVVLSTAFKRIQGEIQSIKTDISSIDTDLKVKESLINRIERDVNSNTLSIKDTYRKGEVDTIQQTIIQQTQEMITESVSETNSRVEIIENTKRYHMDIASSGGTAFRNGEVSTTLSVSCFSWDSDITAVVSDATVRWSRISADADGDASWSRTGKSTVITSTDFVDCATFLAKWNGIEQRISLVNVNDGESSTPGKDGKDGRTTYFHVKYAPVANPTDEQMVETPDKYIGTYVDYLPEDSTVAQRYTWSKFTGDDGIPGQNGENGQTSYLHIRYSDDGGKTFTKNNGKDPGYYLGQYTDFTQADSTDPGRYTWVMVKGDKGDDSILLHISSSNGYMFKNSTISTTLVVNIIIGGDTIDNSMLMYERFGDTAHLQWQYKLAGQEDYTVMPQDDPRLSDNGFIMTLRSEDVYMKTTFTCDLII